MGRTADLDPGSTNGPRPASAVKDPYPGEEDPTKPGGAALVLPSQWNAAFGYLQTDIERRLFLDMIDSWLDSGPLNRARAISAWFLHTKRG
jgi:hypothetical protein